MKKMQIIPYEKGLIELYVARGDVIDEKKWTTTHVEGGQSGGSDLSIKSQTYEHDQFFLRDDDGGEISATLVDAKLALRKGHRVSLLWGVRNGSAQGVYLAIHNHSINQTSIMSDGLIRLIGWSNAVMIGLCVLGFTFIGGSMDSGNFVALCIGLALCGYAGKRLLANAPQLKQLKLAIDNAINQIKVGP